MPKKGKIVVSDHAFSRYLERIKGVPVSQIKSEMLSELFLKTFNRLKADGTYPTGQGYSLVVREGTVVTVVRSKGRFRKKRSKSKPVRQQQNKPYNDKSRFENPS